MEDDTDTPPSGVKGLKGLALRMGGVGLGVCIGLLGFLWAFPHRLAPDLLPIPPVPPRIAHGPDMDRCLSLLSTDSAAAQRWAEAWLATGGGDPAVHCLALSQIAAGDTEPAAETLETLAASPRLSPIQRGAIEDQAGQAWMMAHDAERAYVALTLALSLDPDEIDWLTDRAETSAALNRFSDALDDLNRALTLDPSRLSIRVLRGAAWRRLDHEPQARADMDIVLERDPDNPGALLERGLLHRLARRNDAARADWLHVMNSAPDSPEAALARRNLDSLARTSGGSK